jgi:hypothetical protein
VDDAPGQPVGAEDERFLFDGHRSCTIAHAWEGVGRAPLPDHPSGVIVGERSPRWGRATALRWVVDVATPLLDWCIRPVVGSEQPSVASHQT